MVRIVESRRRKGKSDEDVLPTATTAKNGDNSNGKGKRAKKIRLFYIRLALVSLVIASALFFLAISKSTTPQEHLRSLSTLVHKHGGHHLKKLSSLVGHHLHKPGDGLGDQQEIQSGSASEDASTDDDYSLEALTGHQDHGKKEEDSDLGCGGAHIHEISRQERNPAGLCINDPKLMPKNWRAPHDVNFEDDGSPWTEEEQKLSKEAEEKGLDELIEFFDTADEDRIRKLGTDAINSLFDYVIGSGDAPKFHQKALDSAIKVLYISTKMLVGEEVADFATECSHMYQKFKITGYGNRLQLEQPDDAELKELQDELVENLNESIHACSDDLNEVLDNDVPWRVSLRNKNKGESEVYNWAMWAIAITECLVIHELDLPEDSPDFVADVWRYFEDYGLPDYHEDFEDDRGSWVELAYLATHLQFVPTGYGRHYHYVKDAPYLYHFYRDNFFVAFERGGHDLVAEFIDMIGTYGCTVENDIQLRHGVRYMLHLYKEAGHSFVKHRERWESRILEDYDRIHKPWTGIASVMTESCFEPEVPGSYGHAFRQALKAVPVEEE